MDIAAAKTNLAEALKKLDETEGLASDLRLSHIGAINGAALETYDRNLGQNITTHTDYIRDRINAAVTALS